MLKPNLVQSDLSSASKMATQLTICDCSGAVAMASSPEGAAVHGSALERRVRPRASTASAAALLMAVNVDSSAPVGDPVSGLTQWCMNPLSPPSHQSQRRPRQWTRLIGQTGCRWLELERPHHCRRSATCSRQSRPGKTLTITWQMLPLVHSMIIASTLPCTVIDFRE